MNPYLYSKTTKGFYTTTINSVIPTDAVEVSEDQYKALLTGQAEGFQISPNNAGVPELTTPVSEGRVSISGFMSDVKTMLGGIVAVNNIMRLYPVFLDAVKAYEWGDVADLIIDAKTAGAITTEQYTGFQAAFTANNIPVTLP